VHADQFFALVTNIFANAALVPDVTSRVQATSPIAAPSKQRPEGQLPVSGHASQLGISIVFLLVLWLRRSCFAPRTAGRCPAVCHA